MKPLQAMRTDFAMSNWMHSLNEEMLDVLLYVSHQCRPPCCIQYRSEVLMLHLLSGQMQPSSCTSFMVAWG
jgi:hypothetical protein